VRKILGYGSRVSASDVRPFTGYRIIVVLLGVCMSVVKVERGEGFWARVTGSGSGLYCL